MRFLRYFFLFISSMSVVMMAFLPNVPDEPIREPSYYYEGHNNKSPAPKTTFSPPSTIARQASPRKLIVRATAYNALAEQTDSTPNICAWGDKIRPGVIAISRDLEKLGLTRGKEVYVKGYGKKIVLDRMHSRKRNQIDLYMEEYDDAIQFGVRELEISWHDEDGQNQGADS